MERRKLLAVGGSTGRGPSLWIPALTGPCSMGYGRGAGDAARAPVIHALADAEGVLIVDETGFLKKAAIPPGYSANTVARRAGSRTVRSACFWPMPVVGDRG